MSASIGTRNKGLIKKTASGESLGKLSLGMTKGNIGLFTEGGDKLAGVRKLDIHTSYDDLIVVTVELVVSDKFFNDKHD